jgi:hypothetical protein
VPNFCGFALIAPNWQVTEFERCGVAGWVFKQVFQMPELKTASISVFCISAAGRRSIFNFATEPVVLLIWLESEMGTAVPGICTDLLQGHGSGADPVYV